MPIGVYARKNSVLKNLHTKKKKIKKKKNFGGFGHVYLSRYAILA